MFMVMVRLTPDVDGTTVQAVCVPVPFSELWHNALPAPLRYCAPTATPPRQPSDMPVRTTNSTAVSISMSGAWMKEQPTIQLVGTFCHWGEQSRHTSGSNTPNNPKKTTMTGKTKNTRCRFSRDVGRGMTPERGKRK